MYFFINLYKDLSTLPEDIVLDILKKFITKNDLLKFSCKVQKEVISKRNKFERYIDFDIYKNKKSKKLSKKEFNNKIRVKNNINFIDVSSDYYLINLINCECEQCSILSKKLNF